MLGARVDEKIDWRPLLSRVECPVLFLYGRDDPMVDGNALKRTVGEFPAMSANGFTECRHEVFSDRPQAFRETVLEFLGR
jgi:pimeloyl-ACP methyl ester carboxylesterase